jgi:dTDP-4-amino-4,6-dideoxygalactose transaminase
LKPQAQALHDEFDAALWSVIDRAAYTMGPELKEFEAAFAAFCGCECAVGVSSGTDAPKLVLLGANVRPGDEVFVPANTFIATAEGVSHIGAVPVFVDCLEETALVARLAMGASWLPALTPW